MTALLRLNATSSVLVDGSKVVWTERSPGVGAAGGSDDPVAYTGTRVMMAFLGGGRNGPGLDPSRGSSVLFDMPQGRVEPVSWSPDGSMLAFVSDRGDHSYVGVLMHPSRPGPPVPLKPPAKLVFLDPGYDNDVDPMWADDSITVVWRRELDTTGPDGRDTRCVEHGYCNRGGPAFSIMAAELGAGSRPTVQ